MTITTNDLSRAAGLCAVVSGFLYTLPFFIHPDDKLASVTTTAWTAAHLVTLTMAVLGLIGVTGMYLRHVEDVGVLGLIGYLLLAGFFLIIVMVDFVEAAILPKLADVAPAYVNDFLATVRSEDVKGDVGLLSIANGLAAVTYLLGGVVFGIELYRAKVLARWAALLLVLGTLSSLLVALLPKSLDRLATIPVGVAIAGLGYSLWRESTADDAAVEVASVQPVVTPKRNGNGVTPKRKKSSAGRA